VRLAIGWLLAPASASAPTPASTLATASVPARVWSQLGLDLACFCFHCCACAQRTVGQNTKIVKLSLFKLDECEVFDF